MDKINFKFKYKSNQSSIGYIKQGFCRKIIRWSKPFAIEDSPKGLSNVQMSATCRKKKNNKLKYKSMKRLFIFAVCLITGMTKSFAAEGTSSVTYTVSSKGGQLTVSGMEPGGSTAEFTNTHGNNHQMTAGNTATLTLNGYDGYIVKALTLRMRSNASTGAGGFCFKCGDDIIAKVNDKTAFNKWYNVSAFTSSFTDVNVQFSDFTDGYEVRNSQELSITITASENSLYIQDYIITYQKTADLLDIPRISLTGGGDSFFRKKQITISCEADVDGIYYTMDGTEPTMNSCLYDANIPLYIDKTTTVKAFAVKGDEQTRINTKTFVKTDNIKAIATINETACYMMTKNLRSSSKHLLSQEVDFYHDMILCSPDDFITYAWQINDDGTIQDNSSTKYLINNDANTFLDSNNKYLWSVSDTSIVIEGTNNKRYLAHNTSGYFGAYVTPANNALAHPVNLVKGYLRTGLSTGNFGTICLPYDVIHDDKNGAVFYNIAGKKTEDGKVVSLVLEEETGTLIAGIPYIFESTDNAVCCMYLDIAENENAIETAGNNNGLIGCLSESDVEQGMFILSNNKVIKCGSGCKVMENRAYINMNEVQEFTVKQSSSKRIIEIGLANGGGTTGIDNVYSDKTDVYYNLHGQQSVTPQKGIYIINGKKIIKK